MRTPKAVSKPSRYNPKATTAAVVSVMEVRFKQLAVIHTGVYR